MRPGGATYLNDDGRKTVVVAYQKRKQDDFEHPILGEKVSFDLLPHVQARLLARHLPGIWRLIHRFSIHRRNAMWIIVAYDVCTETKPGRRRLRRVAQICKNYGQRVQKSGV